ncbi:hypothetical protein NF701_08730 [Sphingomonadaceae bacterium OTU29THOMA1]|nr:hypothetical protein NF701_08730 [Sphingomonadaceae bacterium OTU29THOMA1]
MIAEANSRAHIEALRAWGYRIGLAARDALTASDEIELGVGDRTRHVEAISDHFGLPSGHHCFNVQPWGWLRLSETLATKGLQHFLNFSDERIRSFLQALVPTIDWPAALERLSIKAETRAGRGRIDLLISGQSQGRTWGVVIEAKFEHSLKRNPLGDYRRHGTKLKMALATDGSGEPTGALIVVGKRLCRQTRKKISRNGQWRFVHWHEVLRRFDATLDEPTIDEDFRRFRRTLWERAGSVR